MKRRLLALLPERWRKAYYRRKAARLIEQMDHYRWSRS